MSSVNLPAAPWKFYQHAIVEGHGADACLEKVTDPKTGEPILIFKFPYSGRCVELVVGWSGDHKNLKGHYTWDPPSHEKRTWNQIEFKVLHSGTVFEGIPEGINGLRTWILVHESPKGVTQEHSLCMVS